MTKHELYDTPLERIFAEISMRIQLPPSKYLLACERYRSIAAYLERDSSPLKDKITRFYPQGSMAIGATIAARGKDEEYDIDIVAELLMKQGSRPGQVLDTLYEAIKGNLGSRYYKMVKRRTRCITIYYEDGMHLDITPVLLRGERQERTSDIFHDDPDKPAEPAKILLMNAWGFSEEFKANTKDTTSFAESYARDSRIRDVIAEAEAEEVDPQEDPARKSSDVVALQLIKRFRNTCYADRDGRMPPSVLLSKFVNDAAHPIESIVQALGHHAEYIREQFIYADKYGRLIHEENPTCKEDCFTDRWPLNLSEQRLFISDLNNLLEGLKRLQHEDLAISEMQDLLIALFGEFPTKAAIRSTQKYVGDATRSGSTGHKLGGGLLIGGAVAAASRTARASTNMGGKLPK